VSTIEIALLAVVVGVVWFGLILGWTLWALRHESA
jgi:hypothetical protein